MKALVVNALGGGFDLDDIDIATPIGREVLIDVHASGLCHTDLLFAANNIAPFPAVFGHEVSGVVAQVGPDVTQFSAGDHVVNHVDRARDASPAAPSSVSTRKQRCGGRGRRRA